jgi:hypothetical protein
MALIEFYKDTAYSAGSFEYIPLLNTLTGLR